MKLAILILVILSFFVSCSVAPPTSSTSKSTKSPTTSTTPTSPTEQISPKRSQIMLSDDIKIGILYPLKGPYAEEGKDKLRGVQMAIDEINNSGDVLALGGKKFQLIEEDTANSFMQVELVTKKLIEEYKVNFLIGGTSSDLVNHISKISNHFKIVHFSTTSSPDLTNIYARKYFFREGLSTYASAKILSKILNQKYKKKKYLFITADYEWGVKTELMFKHFISKDVIKESRSITLPFPYSMPEDYQAAIDLAKKFKADVIILSLFGEHLSEMMIKLHREKISKKKVKIVIPNVTISAIDKVGDEVFNKALASVSWSWEIPYILKIPQGIKFVENFYKIYNRYPSSKAAAGYTIVYQIKDAINRAHSLSGPKIVEALENHRYQLLKGQEYWRKWDHQSIQDIYVVEGKLKQNKYDYLKLLLTATELEEKSKKKNKNKIFIDYKSWSDIRLKNSKSLELQ
ncbi:MAG: ABC transporter substrate-binding protein [Oligoflexia bacterium]|nr:ABC transporter substrate-binding protein [Oligoflexia bacterium]